jgi:ribosomal protein L44E
MDAQRVSSPAAAKNGNGYSSSQPSDSELWLQFSCTKCQRKLQVPLRSLGQKVGCPGCKAHIKIPILHGNVSGLEIIQRFFEQAHDTAHTAKPKQPSPKPASPKSSEPKSEKQAAVDSDWDRISSGIFPENATSKSQTEREKQVNDVVSRWQATSINDGNKNPPESEPLQETEAAEPVNERPLVYDGRQQQSKGSALHFPRAAHWTCRAIYWGVLLILFLSIGANAGVALAFLIWMIPFVGGNISEFITSMIVTTHSCPGCKEVFPAVEVWTCACGYKDHTERHVVNFRCPVCKSRIGRTNCRRCGSTILIW